MFFCLSNFVRFSLIVYIANNIVIKAVYVAYFYIQFFKWDEPLVIATIVTVIKKVSKDRSNDMSR